ncbi:MAG: hypothetical protein OEZ48_11570 [Candidatus Bathyarchaeota archaeon]|nr:hypothetical protein [Candidatus Bathyarchaeota archaeon]MDH5688483.1 hypothetical protein [Candidatus Bathyarchaeota archaeon]
MIEEEELKKRKWPAPKIPFRFEKLTEEQRILREAYSRIGADYTRDVYVREGKVILRPLGWKGIVKPIPPEECAITSLARDPRGRIFGATSGRRSHLFVYDPDLDYVEEMGVLGQNVCVKHSLVVCSDELLIAGTKSCKPGEALQGQIISCRIDPYSLLEASPVATPVEGEGIAALTIDDSKKTIYGLSTESGTFFTYEVDSGKVQLHGKVDEIGDFSDVLLSGPDGCVYGGKRLGWLYRYNPAEQRIIPLDVQIPSFRGRAMYNKVDSLALDEITGIIYGGSADGVVFSFDPESRQIICLGKPTTARRVRALTVGNDGVVYGVSGDVSGLAHLFRYDPETRDLRDLGVPRAASEQWWHGYEFDAAITGLHGEIYLGEADRISHLFIYFPPIRKCSAYECNEH